jgi:quinolinate synthase
MTRPLSESEIKTLTEEITTLKIESDAIILVHNYQRPEIYAIADRIGDSLDLAIAAQESGKNTIVFCGVDFMAETSKILSPDSRVLHPAPDACCPMAHMITVPEVSRMKEQYPSAEVVSYVNTTAEIKALSDVCCTSANATDVVRSCSSEQVIFLPDLNLASYVQRFTPKQIIPSRGNCYVHDRITPVMIENMRAFHPNSPFIAHPECRPEVIDRADAVCSTSGMIGYCKDSRAVSFIIGTESGMINRLKREIPEKRFYPVGGVCTPMKQITLQSVKTCLKEGTGEVSLSPEIIETARIPLEKMIRISGKQKTIPCRQMTKHVL